MRQELAPSTVTQIDGIRAVTLTATPDTDNLGALTETVQTRLAELDLPAGIEVELGGASEDQAEAFRELGLAMLLAIVLVYLIMVATFRSLVQPLVLLTSIPFAATGAVAGLLLTDTALGVPAMVGLLMLIGIVVTNAIVLIDLINKKRAARRGPGHGGHPRRPAPATADHHDRDRDHRRADPDGPRPDRRRSVHLPAAGDRGDRRADHLHDPHPAAGAGPLHPGGAARREEAAAAPAKPTTPPKSRNRTSPRDWSFAVSGGEPAVWDVGIRDACRLGVAETDARCRARVGQKTARAERRSTYWLMR